MRILVVEDEPLIGDQIRQFLGRKGFAVDLAATGADGFYLGSEYPIDAAIIDIGLPDISGVELIKKLRKENVEFPILILTARSRWQEKVEGLESGADDYLVKPFHYEELLARLNALIRRSGGKSHPVLTHANIELNTVSQEVTVAGEKMDLTAFEYKVLEYLLFRKGEVVSKSVLTEHIYDEDFDRDSNVIEVFIGRLRKKLDPDGVVKPIETLRGRGYRIPAN
ncbi:MAG: response regulator transcription factor [Methylicorpusculum sp.]|jgi:two-component system response regulator PhoP|uniref:response regulator transcription factor n=1 Tax=Methylicorpusculum TaxID=2713642 RepID=UPI00135B4632|nr:MULTISPECIES: response regulator transcription factor [Methylicorpusculum]MCD2451297.1 response regulator transcription factor [Methylicorpusculum oleiharenae]MDO8846408.1 response regulator transcription factor [Methylicorpusculum sp.]MDO8940757.1 response regulator transcription factor [Methylicorpusculum sp.]MDO9240099.1 response regulator transcription factor [Methylicorpusculum sp.]MDP2180176.1 response regulator transcription factor [Methylicorpusculum sp.]